MPANVKLYSKCLSNTCIMISHEATLRPESVMKTVMCLESHRAAQRSSSMTLKLLSSVYWQTAPSARGGWQYHALIPPELSEFFPYCFLRLIVIARDNINGCFSSVFVCCMHLVCSILSWPLARCHRVNLDSGYELCR